jgi:hypothetical protein
MQVSASPRSGDVALLMSPRGSGHDAPGAGGSALSRALWRSAVPGVNSIIARSTDDGWCNECEYAIGVLGQPAADFTLLVTVERAYTLRDGEPQTAQLLHYGGPLVEHSAYFAFAVDEPVSFSIIVTVYMGNPDLYVSARDPRPSAASFTWQPANASATGGGGIRMVAISPNDPEYCTGCSYYVGVVAYTNASVAVTAVSERLRTTTLVNGLPLKQASAGGEYLYYTFAVGAYAGDLTIAVQPEVGDTDIDIYVTAGAVQPSSSAHTWASAAQLDDEEDQVNIRATDPDYCASCTYQIAVYAERASTFSIAATSASGTTLLALGLPSQQRVALGMTGYFKAMLDPHGSDALLSLVPMRAPLRVLLSTSSTQPSDDFADAVLDAPLGAPTRFVLDGRKLRQWCPPAVQMNGLCPLYIAIQPSAAEDATFSLSVVQGSPAVLIPGLPQLASAEPSHPALFSVGSDDQHDDMAISVSIQRGDGGADEDDGAAASLEMLVSRSGYLPIDDLVGWRARADSSQGGTASIFIGRVRAKRVREHECPGGLPCAVRHRPCAALTHTRAAVRVLSSPLPCAPALCPRPLLAPAQDDKAGCKSCMYYVTVLASARLEFTLVASSERGHTLLVEGSVVHSEVAREQYSLFKTFVNRAKPNQSLLITARAGAARAPR